MKTSAKWISENNYILNNSKHLSLAVTDPSRRKDNYELNCLDLALMGFTGCITAEFRKHALSRSITILGIETDVEIRTLLEDHPNFAVQVTCNVKSNAPVELLKECLEKSIDTSFLAILFVRAGIKIHNEIRVTTTAQHVGTVIT
jgi:uncharacterized OsmC-like protein